MSIYRIWCYACVTVIFGVVLYGIVTGENLGVLLAEALRGLG